MGGAPAQVIKFDMMPHLLSSRSHCWADAGAAGVPRRVVTPLAGVLPLGDTKMTTMARTGERAVRPSGMILVAAE